MKTVPTSAFSSNEDVLVSVCSKFQFCSWLCKNLDPLVGTLYVSVFKGELFLSFMYLELRMYQTLAFQLVGNYPDTVILIST